MQVKQIFHFIFEDFLHWKFLGKAIEPSEKFDNFGTYSGSACVVGENFQKFGIILETPKNFTEHFRDPKIHFDGKNFKIFIGAQKIDGKGAIVFSKSADGKNFG